MNFQLLLLLPCVLHPFYAQGMKGWVFLLPTITKEDAEAYFPEHKTCQVPSGQGEHHDQSLQIWRGLDAGIVSAPALCHIVCMHDMTTLSTDRHIAYIGDWAPMLCPAQ